MHNWAQQQNENMRLMKGKSPPLMYLSRKKKHPRREEYGYQ
jgi:hypothetical protein